MFSFVFRVTGIRVPEGEYKGVNSYFFYGVYTFRNSIGDLTVPDFSFWDSKKEEAPMIAQFMMYFGWFLWIFCYFLNETILFNFLIAIISNVYDETIVLNCEPK